LRFVRETSHRIDHPHVVTPLGWAGEDDRVLFTMPLVHGGSLATLLGDFGALPVGWAVELLRQSLTALEAVHAVGLVHRDVKPGNLLLHDTGSGRPHLLLSDFGAAAQVSAPRLTRSDSVIGTPGYFAPEQIRGADPDPLQDVYAVAVVTLQTVTGQPPTSAGDLPAYLPRTALEHALADLLKEMTVAEPGHRTPGARAARARLDAIEGSDDHQAGADPLSPVEVFDHVPPLPEGWDTHGPRGRCRRGVAGPTEHSGGATPCPGGCLGSCGDRRGADPGRRVPGALNKGWRRGCRGRPLVSPAPERSGGHGRRLLLLRVG